MGLVISVDNFHHNSLTSKLRPFGNSDPNPSLHLKWRRSEVWNLSRWMRFTNQEMHGFWPLYKHGDTTGFSHEQLIGTETVISLWIQPLANFWDFEDFEGNRLQEIMFLKPRKLIQFQEKWTEWARIGQSPIRKIGDELGPSEGIFGHDSQTCINNVCTLYPK